MAVALSLLVACGPDRELATIMHEALVLAYATAVGFAVSGALSTLIQLMTRRPVAFALPDGSAPAYVLTALSFILIGPYVVARTSLHLVFVEGRSWGFLSGGAVIALGWSACSGIILLGLVLSAS